MADLQPFPIRSLPGVKRDGTSLDGNYHSDAQWVRWDETSGGRARKMGGYRNSSSLMHGPSRGLFMQANGLVTQIHNGWSDGIERVQIDSTGLALGPPVDRTPAGFAADPLNLWISDVMYNAGSTNAAIIAVAPPAAEDIATDTAGTIYYGDVNDTAALVALAPTNGPAGTSGGLFVAPPYLVVYGSNGYISWSEPNTPTDFSTAGGGGGAGARIANTKLIAGQTLRGGPGNSPAALLWSLNALIRQSFQGGSTVFGFDTISSDITVLSQKCMVEFDGAYIWPGLDRFYVFSGVVQELPNTLSRNWFFDNLNFNYSEKVFVYKNARWGEIWWCFPFGNATECTHALIYNKRLNCWYDTLLPNGGRSAAVLEQIVRFPMMMGSITLGADLYRLWQHEYGVDEVIDVSTVNAIDAFFETSDFSVPYGSIGQPQDIRLTFERVEPDFVLDGALALTVSGRKLPLMDATAIGSVTLDPAAFDPADPQSYVMLLRAYDRIVRFRFESNVVGGNFQKGNTIGLWQYGGKGYT